MKWSLIRRKLGRVDRALDKAIADSEIPGAVVLARMPREGELVEHESVRGFAVLRPERIPMARETLFDLASLTKPMATTSAVLLLVHEGGVGLDDPVAKFVPSFAERGKEGVTLRHLLSHSSGLKPWRGFHELLLERERKSLERDSARARVVSYTVICVPFVSYLVRARLKQRMVMSSVGHLLSLPLLGLCLDGDVITANLPCKGASET